MRTIAIAGGKGGVGKTTISTGLAIALAQKGHKTVLFDADLALANVDVVLGLRSEFTLQHVINDEKTLREILHDGPGGIMVATGASGVAGLVSAGPKKLKKFFTQVFAIENETDYLIFDTGSGIDRRILAFSKASDDAIVVITPDAASLTDGYATIKSMFRAKHDAHIHVLVNMVDSEVEAERTFNAMATIVHKFLKKEISYFGSMKRDPAAARCVRSRQPFVLAEPKCSASLDIKRLAKEIENWGSAPERQFSERILDLYDAA